MRFPLRLPIVIPRLRVTGPQAWRELDVILDTGAVYTVIAWDVLRDVGYNPARSERTVSIVTANGVIEAPLVSVEAIELGDLRVSNLDVVCHDIPELAGIEGLLGLNFLRHFRVVIDYPNALLEIHQTGTIMPQQPSTVQPVAPRQFPRLGTALQIETPADPPAGAPRRSGATLCDTSRRPSPAGVGAFSPAAKAACVGK